MNHTWNLAIGDRVKTGPHDRGAPKSGVVVWLAARPMCLMELGEHGFDMLVRWDGEDTKPAFHGSVVKAPSTGG